VAKPVRLTSYARGKLVFLREHGFPLSERHLLRVIYAGKLKSLAK
jgi:hypothetical protein